MHDLGIRVYFKDNAFHYSNALALHPKIACKGYNWMSHSLANLAFFPNFSSILSSLLYFAVLSLLAGAPNLLCDAPRPTDKSAINESSVSPERWLTTTFHLFLKAISAASIDSVTVPIWLTFSNNALHAFSSSAFFILFILVTNKSSPTICILSPNSVLNCCHPSQSSCAKPSSIEFIGNFLISFL